jgi:hypothetical protein
MTIKAFLHYHEICTAAHTYRQMYIEHGNYPIIINS